MRQGTSKSLHLCCLAANFKTGSSLPTQVLTCLEVCCNAAASDVLCWSYLMPNDTRSSNLICACSITHDWPCDKAQASHFICAALQQTSRQVAACLRKSLLVLKFAATGDVLCWSYLMPNDARSSNLISACSITHDWPCDKAQASHFTCAALQQTSRQVAVCLRKDDARMSSLRKPGTLFLTHAGLKLSGWTFICVC